MRADRAGGAICLAAVIVLAGFLVEPRPGLAVDQVPLYGLFEVAVTNPRSYGNPFSDVELRSVFTSPTGRKVNFFGFYDGDGQGGQTGHVWKQRFMPDELGEWTYVLSFSDGSPGGAGRFECVSQGAKPGPWRPDEENLRWFKTASGHPFLPIAMHANVPFTPVDWQDVVEWVQAKGFNTVITATLNAKIWGQGWRNVTPFLAVDSENRVVDYDRFNIPMWREWDEMIQAFGEAGIYVGPFEGASGDYGGRSGVGTLYPPEELAYRPTMKERFDTARNLRVLRYWVARQASFWNLAYWNLYSTEIYEIKPESEVLAYGEYLASITPFHRMITAQDIEQGGRAWLSEMEFPASRKLNTIQVGPPDDTGWQEAGPNNAMALASFHGFPVLSTEALWEGQPRAMKPLRMIWGSFAAGAHTMWADWSYDLGYSVHLYGSLGKGWTPLYPLTRHVFRTDQLGMDTTGDEQLVIAATALGELGYWRMNPHNELVYGSTEAYCLAEPGVQYLIYAPIGGVIRLDLTGEGDTFEMKWLDPREGGYVEAGSVTGGAVCRIDGPSSLDWILIVTREQATSDPPTILVHPAGQTVQEGTPVRFEVIASGPGPLSFQWQRNGQDIPGARDTSYCLPAVTPEEDGLVFRCVVANRAGSSASQDAVLRVIPDREPPRIVSVVAEGEPRRVVVSFSEPVEETSATSVANYAIDNGIAVERAILLADYRTVWLETSPHTEDVVYTLTVSGVRDRAYEPNTMDPDTRVAYSFVSALWVTGLEVESGRTYEVSLKGLEVGGLVYVDRSYTYLEIPVWLEGAVHIRTANDDKGSSGQSFVSFDVNTDVIVYVAYDDRLSPRPAWLASFVDTGEDVSTTDTRLSLYAKTFSAGSVVLGGNEGSNGSMYTILLVPANGAPPPDRTPPTRPTGLTIHLKD